MSDVSSTPEENQAVLNTPSKEPVAERPKMTDNPETSNTNSDIKAKWKKVALKGMLKSKESKQQLVASETRTSKLRAELIAGKGGRDGTEERIRNMEQKKEIESLKRFVEDLKGKLSILQKQTKHQEEILDGLKKNKKYRENDTDYIIVDKKLEEKRQENVLKIQFQLDEILQQKEQLSKECGKLKSTNEELLKKIQKTQMDLEVAEATVASLESQNFVNEATLKQTSGELERRVEEVKSLSKIYEEKIQEKEKQRLDIEKENKEMIESLKKKCDVSIDLETKLETSERFVDEQNIALNDLIKLVSDLEVEKTQWEEEKANLRAELGSTLQCVGELQTEKEKILIELQKQSKNLETKSKIIEETQSSLASKDLQIQNQSHEIDELKLRTINHESNLERLAKEKEYMEDRHGSSMSDLKDQMDKLKSNYEEMLNSKDQEMNQMVNGKSKQESKIKTLEQHIDELEHELKARHSELANHSQSLDRYKDQLAMISAEKSESMQKHEAIISGLQEELDYEKSFSKDLTSQLESTSKDFLSDKEKMKADFDAQLKLADDEIVKKRVQLESKACTIETLTVDNKGLELNLELLETKLKHQLEENEDLERKHAGEIATLKDLLDIANTDCTEKETRCNEKLLQQTNEIESCKKQSDEIMQSSINKEKVLHAEIQNLKDALQSATKENDSLSAKLEVSLEECQETRTKLDDFRKRYAEINETTATQDVKITAMKNELEVIKNDLDISKELETNLRKENDELYLKIALFEEKITVQNTKVNDLIENNEKQSKIQKEVADNKAALQNVTIKELNEKLKKTSEEIMRLELENRDLKCDLKHKLQQSKQLLDREQTISKLEYENMKVRSEAVNTKELIENLKSDVEKAEIDNKYLKEKLDGAYNENKIVISNLRLENKKLLQEIQYCQKSEKHQLSVFKNTYDSKNEQHQIAIKEKEMQLLDLQEKLNKANTAVLMQEKDLRELKSKLDEERFASREKDMTQEERELFFCNEISRMQTGCRNKILEVETEKEKSILEIERNFDGHLSNLKDEYENNILGELRDLQAEYYDRLNLATNERDELIKTLQKLESVNLQQKIHYQKLARELRENNQKKTQQLSRYQLMFESQQRVFRSVTKYLENGEVELTRAKEILELLKKMEKDIPDKFEITKPVHSPQHERLFDDFLSTRSTTNLNITWPQSNCKSNNTATSAFRRNSHELMPSIEKPVRSAVEHAKSAICLKMKDLENLKTLKNNPGYSYSPINRYMQTEVNHNSLDHYHPERISSCYEKTDHSTTLSEITVTSNESSPTDKHFPNIPTHWQSVTSHLGDSGFAENSLRQDYARSQLSEINKEFLKFDLECVKIENEDPIGNEKWLFEVKKWKEQMQEHLLMLLKNQNFITEKDEADGLRNEFPKCILFHPSQAEVNAIISKVNRQYDLLKESF